MHFLAEDTSPAFRQHIYACFRTWPSLHCGVQQAELVANAGTMADELQKKAADETASLRPPHSYVPWITVNGIALGGAFEQLQISVCAAYLGDR